MNKLLPLLALVIPLTPLVGCDAPLASDEPDVAPELTRGAIINGTTLPAITPLSAGQLLAVGYLADASGAPFCSGTVIAANAALTAQHCVDDRRAADVRFGVGDPASPRALLRVRSIRLADWESDLALLELSDDATSVGAQPIGLNRAALGDELVGEDVEVAGYAPISGVWARRFAVLEVTSVFDAMTLNGFGQRGACQGDSGGPALFVGGAGAPVVGGTAIGGDLSCRDEVYYSRVDRHLAWLDEQLASFATARPITSGTAGGGASSGQDPWSCKDAGCASGVAPHALSLLLAVWVLRRRARRSAQGR